MASPGETGRRYLCIGDPHIRDKYLARSQETLDAIVKIAQELAEKEEIDEIVDLGDTLHSFKSVDQNCLGVAISWFRQLAQIRPLKILIGNHDRPSHNEFLTSRHPFHGLDHDKNITIVWRSYGEWLEDLQAYIVWMPYVQKGLHGDALNSLSDFEGKSICVSVDEIACEFSHGEYRGAVMDGHVSKTGDAWNYSFPNISGHIHDHQYIGFHQKVDEMISKVGGVVYVGTPSQVAANESEYKTISLITVPFFNKTEKNHIVYERRIAIPCTVIKTKIVNYKEMLTWSPEEEQPDCYGRKIIWRLIIYDEPSKFITLRTQPAYDRLCGLGVQLQTRPLPIESRATTDISPIANSTRDISYLHGLYQRLDGEENLRRRLRTIIERSMPKK